MTPIRPSLLPPEPTARPQVSSGAGQGADAARAAAQKAFFDAAMGRAAAPAAPRAADASQAVGFTPAAMPPARAELRPAALPQDPPLRILRPGSLLDIRV